nr:alanine racemase [Burkholderia lata]
MMRPTIATIHLDALRHNLEVARRKAGRARVMAMLKANAYGHGLLACASALAQADGFGVIELDAALELRNSGWRKPILLLDGYYESREIRTFFDHDLTPTLHCQEQIDMLSAFPASGRLDVFLKINSGMNRLGFDVAVVPAVLEQLRAIRCVSRIVFMTHFGCADGERGIGFQTDRLAHIAVTPDAWSMANSAALMAHPQAGDDIVRPGIMLYGSTPLEGQSADMLDLAPAMTLESRIIGVQTLSRGEVVGYGATYQCPAPMRIGIVACGYGDGYPRHAGTGAPVGVDGRIAKTVGRISMDKLAIDITHLPDARVGTRVELWGKNVSVDRVAEHAGTSGYELLSAVTARVPRVTSDTGPRDTYRPAIATYCH